MGMKGELIIDHSRSKMQRGTKVYSGRAIFVLCFASFFAGSLFSSPAFYWTTSSSSPDHFQACDHKRKLAEGSSNEDQSGNHVMKEVENAHQTLKSLDKTMSRLTTELATAKASTRSRNTTSLVANRDEIIEAEKKIMMMTSSPSSPVLVVVGVNTAFSSRRRRDSVRQTWMSAETRKIAMSKRVVMRFVIGRSSGDDESPATAERDLDSEAAEHGDFLRLGDHVEGYHRLSSKTKAYFSAAVAMWPEARFFVKVDDDVHVNPRALVNSLAAHAAGIRARRRVYVGCMKSGPVLHDVAQKYYEPEFEMFGDRGNGYFRHATGQIYAVSNELASYIAKNAPILHTYANEDVSLGAWLLGLDVERVDDRSMCCGTPSDCEWRAQEGNVCVASFDWHCSGICNSEERMKVVHASCGEGVGALSSLDHIP